MENGSYCEKSIMNCAPMLKKHIKVPNVTTEVQNMPKMRQIMDEVLMLWTTNKKELEGRRWRKRK